jgi:hypothetical protein
MSINTELGFVYGIGMILILVVLYNFLYLTKILPFKRKSLGEKEE